MNSWLRLWHDMPTDPKFRTVAKVSKQPLCVVIAIYTFMLVDASNASERGRTQANDEDVASALDLEIEQVTAIRSAMQGRVLDGNYLTGWGKRQPKREDNSAERSKAWREEKKKLTEEERKRTQANANDPKIKIREDTDNKEILPNGSTKKKIINSQFEKFWAVYPRKESRKKAEDVWNRKKLDLQADEIITDAINRKAKHLPWQDKQFIPHATTYLNGERWRDEIQEKHSKNQETKQTAINYVGVIE